MATDFTRILTNAGVGKGKNLMRFVTSIKYTAQIAKVINNITFLYDPNWTYGAYEQSTFPMAFYFVKKWEEIGEAEISTKPMLFYNSKDNQGTQRNSSVLEVVADNIVLQPKVYRLDVLVPFMPSGCLDQYQLDTDMIMGVNAFSLTENSATLATASRWVSNSVALLRALFKVMSVDINTADISSFFLSQTEINKLSLDAMHSGRGILKMKMWNGWRFKYIMLKSMDLQKSGEYEGFYEGSLTVQEVPVLNVFQEEQVTRGGRLVNEFNKAVGETMKKGLNKFMGYLEEV